MMIAFVRKNLAFSIFKHTSSVCISPISLSLSPLFFSTWKERQPLIPPKVFDILLQRHNFPSELASRVASRLSRIKNPENVDSILSFFKEYGFSDTQLERISKIRPALLCASLEDSIKPKIKIFQDIGFSTNDVSRMILANPGILSLSLNNNIVRSLSLLKGLLGSNSEVARVLRGSPRILGTNLQNTLVPNVEFLKSCGIPMERIRMCICGFPSSFPVKPEIMRKSAEKAKEMGVDGSSKMFLYAIITINRFSNGSWELKLKAFKDLGFSESDILILFRKAPLVFLVSVEKIKKVKEILLATGKFSMSCIVSYPMSLAPSVEKRYIPRLQILGILESRSLIKDWPKLSTIGILSDDKFFKKFISPYLNEISDVYDVTKNSSSGKKELKP